MAAVRWLAILLGVECLACLFFAPYGLWSTVVVVIFSLCFVTVCWTFGAFSTTDSRKAHKP